MRKGWGEKIYQLGQWEADYKELSPLQHTELQVYETDIASTSDGTNSNIFSKLLVNDDLVTFKVARKVKSQQIKLQTKTPEGPRYSIIPSIHKILTSPNFPAQEMNT